MKPKLPADLQPEYDAARAAIEADQPDDWAMSSFQAFSMWESDRGDQLAALAERYRRIVRARFWARLRARVFWWLS